MKHTHDQHTRRLKVTAVLLGLLLVMATAGSGLVLVGWRSRASRTAERVRVMERELQEVQRWNMFLASRMAQAQSPAMLQKYARSGLGPVPEGRTLWIHVPVRMVAGTETRGADAPVLVSVNVAAAEMPLRTAEMP